jgi:hypothetical protein
MAQRAGPVSRYLTITCAQGSADAFVQGTVATGIDPDEGIGLEVKSIDFMITNEMQAISADCAVQWSIGRDTQTAVTGFGNADTILFDSMSFSLTTSGQVMVPGLFHYPQIEGIFIVEPTIYGQYDSTATGVQATAYFRVYVQEIAMSEVDILRVINNS